VVTTSCQHFTGQLIISRWINRRKASRRALPLFFFFCFFCWRKRTATLHDSLLWAVGPWILYPLSFPFHPLTLSSSLLHVFSLSPKFNIYIVQSRMTECLQSCMVVRFLTDLPFRYSDSTEDRVTLVSNARRKPCGKLPSPPSPDLTPEPRPNSPTNYNGIN